MHRRDFVSLASLAGLGMGTAGWCQRALAVPPWPIGLQLFTVMTELEQDFERLLKTVAAIGYREVETIGTFGRDPS